MRLVHAHTSDFMVLVIKHRDLVGLLQQLHGIVRENEGDALRPTLVAWARIAYARQRHFGVLLHNFRGRWCQDRIGMIADQLPGALTNGALAAGKGRPSTSKVCLRRALFTTGPGPDSGGSMT